MVNIFLSPSLVRRGDPPAPNVVELPLPLDANGDYGGYYSRLQQVHAATNIQVMVTKTPMLEWTKTTTSQSSPTISSSPSAFEALSKRNQQCLPPSPTPSKSWSVRLFALSSMWWSSDLFFCIEIPHIRHTGDCIEGHMEVSSVWSSWGFIMIFYMEAAHLTSMPTDLNGITHIGLG